MKREEDEGMMNAAGRTFGDVLREYRKRRGLSQEDLGALVDVKKNAVSAWESGRSRPDLADVPVLCEALEMPLSVFFGMENEAVEGFANQFTRLNEYNRQIIMRQADALYEMQEDAGDKPL